MTVRELLDAGWRVVIYRAQDKSGPGGTPAQGSEYVYAVNAYRPGPDGYGCIEAWGRRPELEDAVADAYRLGEERLEAARLERAKKKRRTVA